MRKTTLFLLTAVAAVSTVFLLGCPNDTTTPPTEYTVTFNANGGIVTPESVKVETGKTVSSLPTPTKTDGDTYFWGWYVDKDVWVDRFTESTPVTQDITVYARWESGLYIQDIYTWADEGLTVSYTGNNAHGITVTVGGTADTANDWKAQVQFSYFVRAGKKYNYTFQARSDSGETYYLGRIKYGENGTDELYITDSITPIGTRDQTLTFSSTTPFDVSGEQKIVLNCAFQTGTFHIQIFIEELN
ncbi:hypothetical protein FACS189479_06170 [Spirochaetia bacterium]|nr:hypothetical protein FACS189479_06170 [Spirochaetia bacterium]